MKSLVKEFQEFAIKGNVMDLAVGVIIGPAFGKIVSSLVADIITPLIGVLIGGINFRDLTAVLKPESVNTTGETVPAVILTYGNFLQTTFDFLVIAISIFFVIKLLNSKKRKQVQNEQKEAKKVVNKQEELLAEIRDLLKKQPHKK